MSRHLNEFDWNDAAVDRLRKMNDEGYTGGQIAQAWGVTRNVICAKINRLGLKRGEPTDLARMAATVHDSARKSRAKPPGERKQKTAHKPRAEQHKPLPLLATAAKPRALPPNETPTDTAVTTLELQPSQCKWVITADSPFLHCGAQRVYGRPYCSAHVAKAFNVGTKSERSAT